MSLRVCYAPPSLAKGCGKVPAGHVSTDRPQNSTPAAALNEKAIRVYKRKQIDHADVVLNPACLAAPVCKGRRVSSLRLTAPRPPRTVGTLCHELYATYPAVRGTVRLRECGDGLADLVV